MDQPPDLRLIVRAYYADSRMTPTDERFPADAFDQAIDRAREWSRQTTDHYRVSVLDWAGLLIASFLADSQYRT